MRTFRKQTNILTNFSEHFKKIVIIISNHLLNISAISKIEKEMDMNLIIKLPEVKNELKTLSEIQQSLEKDECNRLRPHKKKKDV